MNKLSWEKSELQTSRPCLVLIPKTEQPGCLPVLYLLHGIGDWETDWFDQNKGQLDKILEEIQLPPMLLVLPFCAAARKQNKRTQTEPPLNDFLKDFQEIQKKIYTE